MKMLFKKILMVFPLCLISFAFIYIWKLICVILKININHSEFVSIGITALCLAVVIGYLRIHKLRQNETPIGSNKDMAVHIFKSADYISEIIAFVILCAVFIIIIGIKNRTPFTPLVFGAAIMITLAALAFAIVDFGIWFIIYKIKHSQNLKGVDEL